MSSIPGPERHGPIPTQPSLELWNSWSSLPLLPSEDDSKKLAGIDWTISGTLNYAVFEMKMKYRITALYTKPLGPNLF